MPKSCSEGDEAKMLVTRSRPDWEFENMGDPNTANSILVT